MTQTSAADGGIQIVDDPVAGTVTADDFGDANPASVFQTAGRPSLSVRLQETPAPAPAEYRIDSARVGSVSLSLRNTRQLQPLLLSGAAPIGGNLTVTAGDGGLQVIETGRLQVTKNATFRGGNGPDILHLNVVGGTSIGGTLTALKFNEVLTNPGDTFGRVSFNAAGDATPNSVILEGTNVLGSLSYVGGTRSDVLQLGGFGLSSQLCTQVGGSVQVNFGNQLGSDSSTFDLEGQPENVIGGRISVTGSASGSERVSLGGTVDGAVSINLFGGNNTAELFGVFTGPTFGYGGGSGADLIVYSPSFAGSVHARFSARLGDGADTVNFGTPTANPSFAFIDFGAGTDTFNGTVNFSCQFLNLP